MSEKSAKEKRKATFIQKYKKKFGHEPKFQPYMTVEEKYLSGEYGVILNYYGFKSDKI